MAAWMENIPEGDDRPLWRREFPDFNDPGGWGSEAERRFFASLKDISWRNDACPSFYDAASGLVIFVDCADRAMSEFPGEPHRFHLAPALEDGSLIEGADNWSRVTFEEAMLDVLLRRRMAAGAIG